MLLERNNIQFKLYKLNHCFSSSSNFVFVKSLGMISYSFSKYVRLAYSLAFG